MTVARVGGLEWERHEHWCATAWGEAALSRDMQPVALALYLQVAFPYVHMAVQPDAACSMQPFCSTAESTHTVHDMACSAVLLGPSVHCKNCQRLRCVLQPHCRALYQALVWPASTSQGLSVSCNHFVKRCTTPYTALPSV